jgi:iron complex outermembrane receptor protein
LKTIFGWQQNQRKEYDDILNKNQFGLYFLMNTFNYELRYLFPEMNTLNISVGVNGMKQNSLNKGTEFLVPEYDLFDIGLFAIAKKTIGKLDLSGGLRFDSRTEQGIDLYLDHEGNVVTSPDFNSIHKFTAFNNTFSSISGSLGFTYQFTEHIFTKFNVSRGFRAPNIGELGANGIHEGTLRYEIGDPKLKAEQSTQLDYALGLNLLHVTADIDLFSNTIDNFIYAHKLQSAFGGDSLNQGYSSFKFASGNAHLYGGEITIDIHPHPYDWLHFENSLSYVQSTQSNQPDSSKYLPFTPPAKYSSELKASTKTLGKYLTNAYIEFGVEHYFKQNKIYTAYNTETATPAYTILNLGIGTEITSGNKTFCSLYININNITDLAYQSHLSRLKYAPVNFATGRIGVFNMGRNISFKVLIPIGS